MTKTNPRRRPTSAADVGRAEKRGIRYGASAMAVIFLTTLTDKENADVETLQRIWREVNDMAESIEAGYVNIPDLRHVLKNEYEIEVEQ